jgi:hypothetical protein
MYVFVGKGELCLFIFPPNDKPSFSSGILLTDYYNVCFPPIILEIIRASPAPEVKASNCHLPDIWKQRNL